MNTHNINVALSHIIQDVFVLQRIYSASANILGLTFYLKSCRLCKSHTCGCVRAMRINRTPFVKRQWCLAVSSNKDDVLIYGLSDVDFIAESKQASYLLRIIMHRLNECMPY